MSADPDPQPGAGSRRDESAKVEPRDAGTGPPSAAARNVVVGLAIAFTIAAWVGDSLLSLLVDRHPALLIALNARNRNMVLAKGYLDWWTFFGIGIIRLVVSDPLFFLLGRWYGDSAVRWMERRAPTYGGLMRTGERWFGKASYPLLAIAPNNVICLFAGAGGMTFPVFLALNVAGTAVRLGLLWFFGDVASDPLDWLRELITENRLPVLAISVGLVALSILNERRSGGTEIGGLLHLEDEVAKDGDTAEADDGTSGRAPSGDAAAPEGD